MVVQPDKMLTDACCVALYFLYGDGWAGSSPGLHCTPVSCPQIQHGSWQRSLYCAVAATIVTGIVRGVFILCVSI